MNVQVRDALADADVDRDEDPFRGERNFDRVRKKLDASEEGEHEIVREIDQILHVCLGHEEKVSRGEGPVIEESDAGIIAENEPRGNRPADDSAEETLPTHVLILGRGTRSENRKRLARIVKRSWKGPVSSTTF